MSRLLSFLHSLLGRLLRLLCLVQLIESLSQLFRSFFLRSAFALLLLRLLCLLLRGLLLSFLSRFGGLLRCLFCFFYGLLGLSEIIFLSQLF